MGVINRYREFLPVSDKTPVITLLEGNTPLIRAVNIPQAIGLSAEIYFKYEGLNPTGSFKDRGMTMAISKAVEAGSKAVICASTGNTSASAAAYCARAGLKCVVVIPDGNIALGKLAQAMVHGAIVAAIKGNFDKALEMVREMAENYPIEVVNSINPFRIQGQKTGAFEICDTLGDAPDFHALPVGNAGNITAYWKGYQEYFSAKKSLRLPRMLGFQAAGSAPIVKGKPIAHPKTIATAIKIGNPASWPQAVAARDESKGLIDMVTDKQILAAYKFLAGQEGVFCEPASAASVAGLFLLKGKGFFRKLGKRPITIACVLTGHGLKDPNIAVENVRKPVVIEPKLAALARMAGF